ncbi:hypothetical protein [Arenimonas composti]|uniref:Beta-hexosaminidase bacterial type N-terminal domain-containing protein n=1 Tax=Arenimonas composti TR7-09 = DSM 18010 TaxID=1121013 RepID=A0A091BC41_9GAMM|nr:hypothetical protein [Arenimonas composti]KFN49321.1 hypothetical protein P873_11140 [Arenimonas composti TR7-09 = DSM 18010]
MVKFAILAGRVLVAAWLVLAPATTTAATPPDVIVVDVGPYEDAATANADSANVEWLVDGPRSDAVTLAWAALELQAVLAAGGIPAEIRGEPSGERHFALRVLAPDARDGRLGDQGFRVSVSPDQVLIEGNTRIGVLYGVYAVIERLGVRWYSEDDVVVPAKLAVTEIDWEAWYERPSVQLRGFWIPMDSGITVPESFAIWMARNRLNLSGTLPLHVRRKLGIHSWQGGHRVLQEILSEPGLFEAHPEWFGFVNGKRQRIDASTGSYHNPAFENPEMAAHVADRIVERLQGGDLEDADFLAVWSSDGTNRGWDDSAEARSVGNNVDNINLFYIRLAGHLRDAYQSGRLERPVTVTGMSYNLTWVLPSRPDLVDELREADYLHLYYEPTRSFTGSLAEPDGRPTDSLYLQSLADWKAIAPLRHGVVEYFNNSSYGGLPISDHQSLMDDFRAQMGDGAEIYAYMHPVHHPGPRKLTNWLMARISWLGDVPQLRKQVNEWTTDYFKRRYGNDNWREMRDIYALSDKATGNAREMILRRSLWDLLFRQHHNGRVWTPGQVETFASRFLDGGIQAIPEPNTDSADGLMETEFVGLRDSLAMLAEARERLAAVETGPSGTGRKRRLTELSAWLTDAWRRYELLRISALYYREVNGLLSAPVDRIEQHRVRIENLNRMLSNSPYTNDTVSSRIDQRGTFQPPERLEVD